MGRILSPSPNLSSPVSSPQFSFLLSLSHFGIWMRVFLFCREQCWFYTPGNERIQLDKEFSGSESLLFPVVLFVFFTSLLAAHKSAKLLINGTARYHIFTLEVQSKLSQPCSTALKNETVTTCCKVLKEFSCRHCPRVASTWLNESFKGKNMYPYKMISHKKTSIPQLPFPGILGPPAGLEPTPVISSIWRRKDKKPFPMSTESYRPFYTHWLSLHMQEMWIGNDEAYALWPHVLSRLESLLFPELY